MKKQKIQFIVILIVLAVLIAATFGMKWYNKNKEEEKTAEEEASTIYISKVDVDTITAFSYEVDHVTYTFTRMGIHGPMTETHHWIWMKKRSTACFQHCHR